MAIRLLQLRWLQTTQQYSGTKVRKRSAPTVKKHSMSGPKSLTCSRAAGREKLKITKLYTPLIMRKLSSPSGVTGAKISKPHSSRSPTIIYHWMSEASRTAKRVKRNGYAAIVSEHAMPGGRALPSIRQALAPRRSLWISTWTEKWMSTFSKRGTWKSCERAWPIS